MCPLHKHCDCCFGRKKDSLAVWMELFKEGSDVLSKIFVMVSEVTMVSLELIW